MRLLYPSLLFTSLYLVLFYLYEVSSQTSLLPLTTNQVFNFENPPMVKNARFPRVLYDAAADFEL